MSPAIGDTEREGRGPGRQRHGRRTEGSGVRDAPVWHNRGSAKNHRSVGLMTEMGTPFPSHLSASFGDGSRVLPVYVSR